MSDTGGREPGASKVEISIFVLVVVVLLLMMGSASPTFQIEITVTFLLIVPVWAFFLKLRLRKKIPQSAEPPQSALAAETSESFQLPDTFLGALGNVVKGLTIDPPDEEENESKPGPIMRVLSLIWDVIVPLFTSALCFGILWVMFPYPINYVLIGIVAGGLILSLVVLLRAKRAGQKPSDFLFGVVGLVMGLVLGVGVSDVYGDVGEVFMFVAPIGAGFGGIVGLALDVLFEGWFASGRGTP